MILAYFANSHTDAWFCCSHIRVSFQEAVLLIVNVLCWVFKKFNLFVN